MARETGAERGATHEPWRDLRVGDRLRLVKLPPDLDAEDDEVQAFYRDLLESGQTVTVEEAEGLCPRAAAYYMNGHGVPCCHDFPVNNDSWERVDEST